MYTNGHREVCKQLFIIEVLVDDDDQAPAVDTEDLTISLHVLTGIHPHSGCTMQLVVIINRTHLDALLDSSSTHNFVDLEVVAHTGTILTRLGRAPRHRRHHLLGLLFGTSVSAQFPSFGTTMVCSGQPLA